jgi:tRNA (adenine22-N1)-methyltransferase
MDLSLRLKKIASMVDRCERIVDVGTDHAYVPIFLIKNGVCSKAIASDINKGPVEKAKKNIKRESLEDRIECRLGGGLTTIKEGEVNAAVIAGMGGNLIRDILEESLCVFRSLDYVVLQPVQNVDVLRKYIFEKGYELVDEELCKDEDKYYEIMKVRFDNNPKTVEDIFFAISEIMLNKKHPMIDEFIKYKLNTYKKIYNNLNEETISSRKRKMELEIKIKRLGELLQCL